MLDINRVLSIGELVVEFFSKNTGQQFYDAGKEYTTAKSSVTFINYTPQITNAFIKFSEVAEQPVDLIFGRQPIKIGQGVIVDDDRLGFDAIRATGYLRRIKIRSLKNIRG